MIPLRLELDEKTAFQLQNTPQTVKDDVENKHSLLLSQVVRFYQEKTKELQLYALQRIEQSNDEEANEIDFKNEQERKLKSIVKQTASRTEKRVSFSKSPPRVEVLDDYDDYEHAIQHHSPVSPSSEEAGSQASWPVIVEPIQVKSTNRNEAQETEDELFQFEDVMASHPSAADNSVLSHSSLYSPTNSSISDEPEEVGNSTNVLKHSLEPSAIEQFHVGSAPVNILPRNFGNKYEDIDHQAFLTSPKSSNLTSEVDPSNMSLSQRWEWEKIQR